MLNPNDSLPRPGYDNVMFDFEGHRVVTTVLDFDEDGNLVVGNPNWDFGTLPPIRPAWLTSR